MTEAKKYLQKYDALDSQYQPYGDLYKEVTDYLLPAHGSYLDRGDPSQSQNVYRYDKIIKSVGSRANQIFGAGMQGGLCSPSRRWFRMTMADPDLADFSPVKKWLHQCEQIMYKLYAGSNFYTEAHKVFETEGGFGNAVIIQEKDPYSAIRFKCFDIGEYRLACGADGQVDTCYRKLWMTAKQIAEMFGTDNVSNAIKSCLNDDKNPYRYFEIMHVVEPRTNRDPSKMDNTNMAYKSCWMEAADNQGKLLRNSGFEEKPFAAPRWRTVNQGAYGLGPGIEAVGAAKMLLEMQKNLIKGMHKQVDPPLNVPSQFKDMISLLPGAANYTDSADAKITPIMAINPDLAGLQALINEDAFQVGQVFFNDLFMMIMNADRAGREMTATEILQRKEEKMLLLGPAIDRQLKEFLNPMITRTFHICLGGGLIPPPPPDVEGQSWEVEFVSVLAQAQKLVDGQSMSAYLNEAERVVQFDPNLAFKTNFEKYLEEYGEVVGIAPEIIRTEDEYAEIIAGIMQAQQQREQMEQAQAAVGAIGELGRAKTEGTALEGLEEGLSI